MTSKIGIIGLFLATFCVSYSLQNDESLVPVLIWSFKNPGNVKLFHNSIHNYDTPSFQSHLQQLLKHSSNPLLVCFIEPSLSVEDFSSKPTAFPNLKSDISKSKLLDYIPSVYQPYEGIENLIDSTSSGQQQQQLRIKQISDQDNIAKEDVENIDLLIVKMSEPDANRFEVLQKQDEFISATYTRLYEKRKNVIGLLTGELSLPRSLSSLLRYRRSNDMINQSQSTDSEFTNDFLTKHRFVSSGKSWSAMLHYNNQPAVLTVNDKTFSLVKNEKVETKFDERPNFEGLIITFYMADGNKFTFKYKFDLDTANNKWSLTSVQLDAIKMNIETSLLPKGEVSAAVGNSFFTSKPFEFSDGKGVTLSFPTGFQAQPWIKGADVLLAKFGAVNDDNKYFTPGIWMGIFVMAILSLVFTLGITMIMDIRTMDRFDDAKGKTINVNVSE